ncbi:MAG: TIGR01244 family phosphatase [Rhodocyclaceae bacterium]|nr:TIGR01244 family phosphatase [Rhodocyclaceae bacterium]
MDIRRVTPDLAVSPQISPEEVAAVKAAGFASIVCNRPDGESFDQPAFAEVDAAAQAAGLRTLFLPVAGGGMTHAHVEAMAKAWPELPKPVLAYCRSGTRSITLWALSQRDQLDRDVVIAAARNAGYDLSMVL